jgi:hypothetical protein
VLTVPAQIVADLRPAVERPKVAEPRSSATARIHLVDPEATIDLLDSGHSK